MTGGRVVVIGPVGRNFAAGMSGGIAYVYNETGNFDYFCNKQMVELEKLTEEDVNGVQEMLINHVKYTGSPKAQAILDAFETEQKRFVKVFPTEYKRILLAAQKNVGEEKHDDAV